MAMLDEEAKAVQEVAKTTGQGIELANRLGSFFARIMVIPSPAWTNCCPKPGNRHADHPLPVRLTANPRALTGLQVAYQHLTISHRQGYFTIRGIKVGVSEMDLLAMTSEGWKLYHQASISFSISRNASCELVYAAYSCH